MSVKRETVEERKALPLASGVLDYFPDALLVVAVVSRVGNEQHHPGEPLHWDKSKSSDEADALLRHLLDRGTRDTDGLRHSGKVAWRALAMLQRELDREAELQENEDRIKAKWREAMSSGWQTQVLTEADRVLRSFGENPPKTMAEALKVLGPAPTTANVENRGEWPPDTRVDGRLTCCGQTEHDLTCPQYR